jgi:predicted transcriptional regulator
MARSPELERRVLDVLWQGGEWSVRQVLDAVGAPLAYTTIATVLDRLHDKGRVQRVKQGMAWCYHTTRTREEALAAEVGKVLRRAEGAPEPFLVAFLDQVEQADPAALDRLEALIEARKRRS